jgi:type III pantothenate kinase
MKLLVDIGNSRVKWAWLEATGLRNPGAAPHAGADPFDIVQSAAASGRGLSGIAIASVLERSLTESLVTRLSQALSVPVTTAATEATARGVRNAYTDHRQMGPDRWLAMVAAFGAFRTAVCVVNAGTAVTIDAVAADGSHLGGLIIPGLRLMRDSLVRRAAGIRAAADHQNDVATPAQIWGRDTESCIQLGARRAAVCLIEDCMKALRDREGESSVLVLTGGAAAVLQSVLATAVQVRPLLVLEGLALRYRDD